MPAEERRIVTILFSDIVGSTPIAEQLDPEEWREIVESVHQLGGEIVLKHQGLVLQYLGDGLLAIFGAEHASERDPERAINAALELTHQVPYLPTHPMLEMRASIHTGLVVLGEMASAAKSELTASGDAMNLAARLQSAAAPNSVLISHETYRYVRGLFDIVKQAPVSIRGRQGVVQPYLIKGIKVRPFRMVTRGVGGVKTSTIGRSHEMQQLHEAIKLVLQQDRLIWSQIIAEPGLGKTRALGDMTETLDLLPEEPCWLRSQALEGDIHRPYALIRRMWFDRFQIAEDAPIDEAETRWEQQLTEILGSDYRIETLALGLLIGLSFNKHPSIGVLRAQPGSIKPRAIKASHALIGAIRSEKPLILFLEDLQWADRSSWEYLMKVILDEMEGEHLSKGTLVLGTARPEWEPPDELAKHPVYQPLELQPLSDAECTQLVIELLQRSEPLPDDVLGLIVRRAEGIPYYAEEMINWFIDHGVLDHRQDPWRFVPERLDQDLLPQTLHHLLFTRLNALDDVKRQALQVGAVFGRNFWQGGLAALGSKAGDKHLEELEQRGFIQARATSSFADEQEWSFHHDLMREVAYESLLKRKRPTYHRAAAGWLELRAREAERLAEFAGMLGRHCELAGEALSAVDWYLQYDQVLSLLSEVDQRRTGLTRTLALAMQHGEASKIAAVRYHLGTFQESLGDHRKALKYLEQALAAAKDAGDHPLTGLVMALMVVCHTRLGHHDAAAELANGAIELLDLIDDEVSSARIITNVAVYYNECGDIGKSAELCQRQIELTRHLGNKFGEAIGLGNLGYNYLQLGLFEEGRLALELASQITEDLEARRNHAYNMLNMGLAYWRDGDPIAGKKCIEEHACSEFIATQDRFGLGASSYYLGLCLEAADDHEAAMDAYHDARDALTEINVPGMAMDALAGLVRCELEQGHLDQACAYTDELWAFLRKEGPHGMEFPLMAYLACGRMFEACGKSEDAKAAWKIGYDELMTRAENISDKDWRKSFLENIPEHREMMEANILWAES
ncbi:MAG: tetratricopeptide repeat protein [Anaerolineales bacterium]|nr:tetratricopeptide repeat protein [Anaerolineales bacterium]